jgi:hypothetical protein
MHACLDVAQWQPPIRAYKLEKASSLDTLHIERVKQARGNLGLSSYCAIIWFSVTCFSRERVSDD